MLLALDLETTGLDRFKDRIIGIGVWSPDASHFFSDVHAFSEWLKRQPNVRFVMHRGAFDVNFLRHHGVELYDSWTADTRSIASLLIPRPELAEGQKHVNGLENLAISLLGETPYKLDRTRMAEYTLQEVATYCLKDCEFTYRIYVYLKEHIRGKSWDFVESWLMPATKFCAELEWSGIHIDAAGLTSYQTAVAERREIILAELNELTQAARESYHWQQTQEVSAAYVQMYRKALEKAKDADKCRRRYALLESAAVSKLEPFNWNSPEQLKWLLRDYYNLDIRSEREDKETTNEAMLKELDHPVAKKLVEYREVEKLCSTCIPALLENRAADGNVHASYNIGGTRTGRLSSSGPNLQQIPKGRIRSFIQAKEGNSLVTIDYAQIEVRLIAEASQERELLNAFKEEIDPYSIIAQKLLKIDCPVREIKEKFKKERDVSKTAGLSILYGTGAAKLQEVLRKELGRDYSVTECRRFIDDYRNSFPAIQDLRKRLERQLSNGKVAYNLLGRPYNIDSNDDLYMKALNTLVQGSASDLVIWSQTQFVVPALKELGVAFTPRMLIHDEVVLELKADEAELLTTEVIVPAMTNLVASRLNLTVPLKVEYHIGKEWAKP